MRPFVFLLAVASAVPAQVPAPPPADSGVVQGHLYFAESGNPPARSASVQLQPVDVANTMGARARNRSARQQQPEIYRTGPDGSFRIERVAPGTYYVVAECAGFPSPFRAFDSIELLDPNPKHRQWLATRIPTVTVTTGATSTIKLYLWRQGSISGQVRFDDGTPFHAPSGQWLDVEMQGVGNLWTDLPDAALDEDGRFHMSGLLPGRYRLSIRLEQVTQGPAGQNWPASYSLRFYAGGTLSPADAVIVDVKDRQQVQGILLTVPVSRFRRLSGALVDEQERPVGCCMVSIVTGPNERVVTSVGIDPTTGGFTFPYLPAGEYELRINNPRELPPTPKRMDRYPRSYCDARLPVHLEADVVVRVVLHEHPCRT